MVGAARVKFTGGAGRMTGKVAALVGGSCGEIGGGGPLGILNGNLGGRDEGGKDGGGFVMLGGGFVMLGGGTDIPVKMGGGGWEVNTIGGGTLICIRGMLFGDAGGGMLVVIIPGGGMDRGGRWASKGGGPRVCKFEPIREPGGISDIAGGCGGGWDKLGPRVMCTSPGGGIPLAYWCMGGGLLSGEAREGEYGDAARGFTADEDSPRGAEECEDVRGLSDLRSVTIELMSEIASKRQNRSSL